MTNNKQHAQWLAATPLRLAEQITGMNTDDLHALDGELENDLSTAYEEGVSKTFETACEIELLEFLKNQVTV